jgi:pilus assembly protein Flp/PilA
MIKKHLSEFFNNREGATAIEYALLATMVAIAAIGGLTAFSDSFMGMSDATVQAVSDATSHVQN